MITFMNGLLAIMTTKIFMCFFGIAAVTASGLLIDHATCYRRDSY